MRVKKRYKKSKRTAIELTSLLDLLFVMIFVSLLQQKAPTVEVQEKPKPEVIVKEVIKEKVIVKVEKQRISGVQGNFSFYSMSGRGGYPGSYNVMGRYDREERTLSLAGVSWVNKPQGIPQGYTVDMAGLTGVVNSEGTKFSGRVLLDGCSDFALNKKPSSSEDKFKGTWKGYYTCFQGKTGLTLTIE